MKQQKAKGPNPTYNSLSKLLQMKEKRLRGGIGKLARGPRERRFLPLHIHFQFVTDPAEWPMEIRPKPL